ncbi:MAG: acyltransferase [Candidatus Gracilibacteria bacterium]|nr:acyltransferase [Candidatus Gracilibacteria bacterium]
MSQAHPLPGLNGLRALACLSVVVYHLNQHRSIADLAQWNWDLYQFVAMWPVNVSLFFMLSAIMGSLPFWRSILREMPRPRAKNILVNRFFRIAPAYYVALVTTFLLALSLYGYNDGVLLRFAAGATFLSWTHPFTFFPVDINGPLWYISYDMMGALLVIGTMSILVRVRKAFIPLVFLIIGGVLTALHFWFTSLPFPVLGGIVGEWFPSYNPFIFGLHFLLGMIVAGVLIWREKNHSPHSRWYDMLFILVGFGLLSFLWHIRGAGDFDYSWFHSAHRFPLATIPIAFLLLLAPGTKYMGKWLDNHVFHTIARLSYSVYLWHSIVIVLMIQFVFDGQHNLLMPEWLVLVGVTFVGAFSMAWLSYTYIEIPVSNWWRIHSERKRNENMG